MSDFLFDTPWWLLATLLLAGIGIWTAGNKRLEKRLTTAGLCAIGLAVLLGLLSYFIDTDKEKVIKRSRELLASIERRDMSAFASLLHPQVSCAGFGKDALIKAATSATQSYGLRQVKVDDVEIRAEGSALVVKVTVTVTLDFNGAAFPNRSVWDFSWQKHQGQWMLRIIQPLDVQIDVRSKIDSLSH